MSLKYSVLWVDDKIDDFIDLGYHQRISNYLIELFFIPTIETCETAQEAKDLVVTNKYDLILSDYNIDAEKGDDFIQFVRANNINTEILFYTAQNGIPKLDIDRISFLNINSSTAEGYLNLFNKTTKLIDLSIEKLHELTTIRGLVTSETSVLDKTMEDIIDTYFVVNKSAERTLLFNQVIDSIEKSTKDNLKKSDICDKKCTLKLRGKSISEVIHSTSFESSRKARSINKIIEKEGIVIGDGTVTNFYEDYLSKIINIRNDLAHSSSEIRGGKEVLITKKTEGEIFFDANKFSEIRKNILYYQRFLNSIQLQIKNIQM